MLDQPSLIIIIDQWHLYWAKQEEEFVRKSEPDRLPKQIINFIEANTNIVTAVLASYLCSEELYSNTKWYQTRKELFSNNVQYLPMVTADYNENHYMDQETHPILLNYVNSNIKQIAMRQVWELDSYLKQNPEIKNIYMSGSDWNVCVKGQKLGWLSLYEHISKPLGINILVHLDTTTTSSNNKSITPTLDSSWVQINDKIYRYCPD